MQRKIFIANVDYQHAWHGPFNLLQFLIRDDDVVMAVYEDENNRVQTIHAADVKMVPLPDDDESRVA